MLQGRGGFALTLLFFLSLSTPTDSLTQSVCGIDIEKSDFFPENKKLYVRIQVCRENWHKDELIFDWGDGQVDTFQRIGSLNAGNGFLVDIYNGNHEYPADFEGYTELRILGEEIMDDYTNVDDEQGLAFTFVDSMLIYSDGNDPLLDHNAYIGPRSNTLGVCVYEGGIFVESLLMYQNPVKPDTLGFYLAPFPTPGYVPLGDEQEHYVAEGLMFWDSPLVPGMYAVASKAREMRPTDNPNYPDSWTLISTITKAFTILVDSAGLATTLPSLAPLPIVSVYPNPASTQVWVATSGWTGEANLRVLNANGQPMHRETLLSVAEQEQWTFNVEDWPSGVYWMEFQLEEGVVTRKLLVNHK